MSADLGKVIDAWMREQSRWVPSAEIETRFEVPERRLRFSGGKPGLLSFNCISLGNGYKHIAVCTDDEHARADEHDIKPLKARFFVIRARRKARRAIKYPPHPVAAFQPSLF
jgi:hypothetical protein